MHYTIVYSNDVGSLILKLGVELLYARRGYWPAVLNELRAFVPQKYGVLKKYSLARKVHFILTRIVVKVGLFSGNNWMKN
jgi:hypothetical protein